MLIAKARKPSLRWRVFAVCAALFTVPLIAEGLGTEGQNIARNSAFGAVALLGLFGYAFGFRLGPLIFWRLFALVFAIGLMTRIGTDVFQVVAGMVSGMVRTDPIKLVAAAILVWMLLALCLALFRHSELIGRVDPKPKKRMAVLQETFS